MWSIFGRQKREGFPFFFFFLSFKQNNPLTRQFYVPNPKWLLCKQSLEQPRWQGGDRLQSVVQKELEAKYRARAFNWLRQLLKTPSHGPNISAAVEAALRRSKIKQSQPFLLQHAVQETQSSEASVLSQAVLSPQLELSSGLPHFPTPVCHRSLTRLVPPTFVKLQFESGLVKRKIIPN